MPIKKLLDSVIDITRQRDKDALEFSLVATLAEIIPVSKISFYRTLGPSDAESLEEIVHLDTTKNEKGALEYLWQNDAPVVIAEGVLKDSWQNREMMLCHEGGIHSLYAPLLHNDNVVGMLMMSSKKNLEDFRFLVSSFIKIYENNLYILSESEQDTLTGLLNRRSFESRLNRLLELQKIRAKKRTTEDKRRESDFDATTWLVAIDIDHFKRVNDTFGHMYGDEVLLLMSQLMRKIFRKTDLLFRFGGEEFVIVLAPTKDEDVYMVLERFRQHVMDFVFPQVGQVTISIGYAQIQIDDYPPAALGKADQALYFAKHHGRNQVCHYESLVGKGEIVENVVEDDVELF